MNNAYEKHPYFQYNFEKYPTRAQQIEFLTAYVDEFKRTMKEARASKSSSQQPQIDETLEEISLSNNEDKTASSYAARHLNIENLLVEANYFALASNLFWVHWSVCQAASCKIKFEYLVGIFHFSAF